MALIVYKQVDLAIEGATDSLKAIHHAGALTEETIGETLKVAHKSIIGSIKEFVEDEVDKAEVEVRAEVKEKKRLAEHADLVNSICSDLDDSVDKDEDDVEVCL